MSLDISLILNGANVSGGSGIFVREHGGTREITREEWDERYPDREPHIVEQTNSDVVFSYNITHNLSEMALQAKLYAFVWEPDYIGIEHASELIEPLRSGIQMLLSDPDRFKKFDTPNGWGVYEDLVTFVRAYLAACELYPTAKVHASR